MAERPSPTDHPYDPRGEWWSLCKHCGLARAAHFSATPESIAAMQAEFARTPRAKPQRPQFNRAEERAAERDRIHQGGRTRIGYVADDDD